MVKIIQGAHDFPYWYQIFHIQITEIANMLYFSLKLGEEVVQKGFDEDMWGHSELVLYVYFLSIYWYYLINVGRQIYEIGINYKIVIEKNSIMRLIL